MVVTESLRLAKTLPQDALIAAISNDLGNLAASQGKFADALAAYTESFQTAQAASVKLLAGHEPGQRRPRVDALEAVS